MKRYILTIPVALCALTAAPSEAQEASEHSELTATVVTPRQHLSGPRFGFTVFTGEIADQRNAADLEPMMTQFGWQWETQIMATEAGGQALMEWVLLAGGLEQSEFTLSLGWLTGYRLENGLEFGVGPNFSVNKDNTRPTTSMQVAGGATLPFGDLNVPVNLSVGIARGGPRFTTLLGWIVG